MPYEIINIVPKIRCIDPDASDMDWYTEADGRPDLIGHAKTIMKLVVDPQRVPDKHIFRLGERGIQIIISERLKYAFEAAEVSGVTFKKV